ncbi:hypothetical protein HRbin41_00737 [bacterium HR41]|nr:hypothetical protein HRbin41_00737 [bacterium HR41]
MARVALPLRSRTTRALAFAAGLAASLAAASAGQVPRGQLPAPFAQVTATVPGELEPPGVRTVASGTLQPGRTISADLTVRNAAGRPRTVVLRLSASDRALARAVSFAVHSEGRTIARGRSLSAARRPLVDKAPLAAGARRTYVLELHARPRARRFAARALDVRFDIATRPVRRSGRAATADGGRQGSQRPGGAR